jgi:hypothetical protein
MTRNAVFDSHENVDLDEKLTANLVASLLAGLEGE